MRFDLDMIVDRIKDKIYSSTGTSVSHMRLVLKDQRGVTVAELNNPQAPLRTYRPMDGYTLHVIDLDPTSNSRNGWLEDLSLVKKYEMTDAAYDSRKGTVFHVAGRTKIRHSVVFAVAR